MVSEYKLKQLFPLTFFIFLESFCLCFLSSHNYYGYILYDYKYITYMELLAFSMRGWGWSRRKGGTLEVKVLKTNCKKWKS